MMACLYNTGTSKSACHNKSFIFNTSKNFLTHYMLHVALMAFAPSLAFLSFNISFNLYHILLNYILLITLPYFVATLYPTFLTE